MKIGPGDFVVATRANGTRIFGFVERIIDETTQKAVLPRALRRPSDRLLIRPLLGRTMTPFTDATGAITSDSDPRSDKAVLEMSESESFFFFESNWNGQLSTETNPTITSICFINSQQQQQPSIPTLLRFDDECTKSESESYSTESSSSRLSSSVKWKATATTSSYRRKFQ